MMRRARSTATVFAAATLCVALAGCVGEPSDTIPAPLPAQTSTGVESPGEDSAALPEKEPMLLPGGSALANRGYFDFVNERLLEINSNPSSMAIVKNLMSAGFPKTDLEVTPDKTARLGLPATSIQIAVRTSKDCLVGQFQAGAYTSIVGPVINDKSCLIGETATIP